MIRKDLGDAGVDADPRFTMTQIIHPQPLQLPNNCHSPHTESLRFMHVEYVETIMSIMVNL